MNANKIVYLYIIFELFIPQLHAVDWRLDILLSTIETKFKYYLLLLL